MLLPNTYVQRRPLVGAGFARAERGAAKRGRIGCPLQLHVRRHLLLRHASDRLSLTLFRQLPRMRA
jgi:hypothetical protein